MKGRDLFVLPALAVVLSCGDGRQPIGPRAPADPSEIISDGNHCGGANPVECNRDFFFLPPLVPLPRDNSDFELGQFNNTLGPSLKVEICELTSQNLNSANRPSETTPCVAGDPLKVFALGTVNLVNLPRQNWGWWSLFNLPPDGFYYVLWNTRQSNLNVNKYYRIKVLIDGSTKPLGVADVDPMSSLSQWRYSATGEVVQMIDDVLLPIPFRVERGAESFAFCDSGTECVAAKVENVNPDGSGKTIVRYEEGEIPLAGIKLTDGWAPEGVDGAVFIITRVNTGVNNVALGTQTAPCHANLALQQFDACFNYRTVPDLGGAQFRAQVIAAVCFVLHGREPPDPREDWVQLWSSEPDIEGDVPKPLVSVDEGEILTNDDGHNCETQEVPVVPLVGSNTSNPLIRLANTGWGKLTRGMNRVFGVKTAYAVDFGIGGLLDDISNIGPALTAEMRRDGPPAISGVSGTPITFSARIVGTKSHGNVLPFCNGDDVGCKMPEGIPGLPVTFTLWSGSGLNQTRIPFSAGIDEIAVTSGTGGAASLLWTPTTAGTYTLRATGQALGGPVTFTTTVTAPIVFASSWPNLPINLYTVEIAANGVDTRVGEIRTNAGALTITDIALHPDGSLLGVDLSQLYSINRQTGLATSLGLVVVNGLAVTDLVGLAFNANGLLYAGTGGGRLLRRDPSGWVVVGSFGPGLSLGGDLAFAPSGTLYGSMNRSGVSVLGEIDPSTGTATVVSPPAGLGFNSVFGLTFVGSELYGFTSAGTQGSLIRIDTATGTATLVRSIGFGAGGSGLRRIGDFDG